MTGVEVEDARCVGYWVRVHPARRICGPADRAFTTLYRRLASLALRSGAEMDGRYRCIYHAADINDPVPFAMIGVKGRYMGWWSSE